MATRGPQTQHMFMTCSGTHQLNIEPSFDTGKLSKPRMIMEALVYGFIGFHYALRDVHVRN